MQDKTFEELRELSREELIALYDQEAKHVPLNLNLIKEEIWRRDADESNQRLKQMTSQMRWLTWVITIFTVISTISAGAVLYSLNFK